MGRRKHKSLHKHPLCSVCRVSNLSSPFSIPRCSSCLALSRHTICDSCLHKHIFITISQDITKRVICPEVGCNAKLTNAIIQAALVASNHQTLWEEYELKCNWRGTSEQWIKRFAARCPGCLVPIEKNGGCNQVVCKQCLRDKMNPFGANAFGGGFSPQFPGSFPQQGFGQFGSGGGFFNGGTPFQGGNVFPGGSAFPPPSGFPPQQRGGAPFGQGFGYPPGAGGFGYQQYPYGPQFPPGQQPPYGNQNYFGGGSYGKPRSRHGSKSRRHGSKSRRHGSKSRRHQSSSSSSSSDEGPNRGSPFGGRGNPYVNAQSFPNVQPVPPRGGPPLIPPRGPVW